MLLPTYRFDATARHCIRTVARMGGGDVDIFIGDNSENPVKWEFLHNLAATSQNCHVFCHRQNIGGRNFGFLLTKTAHEFIAPASDDDIFTPDYFIAGRDELKANPTSAAASGSLLFLTWHDHQLGVGIPRVHLEETPCERIASYPNGLNALSYSVYRSRVMERTNRYLQDRPFWPSYLDQFVTYTLLCAGKYVVNQSRDIFIYNNNNWTPTNSLESDGRWFASAGLPPEFTHLNRVCWAADVLHFFHSSYRPAQLSDHESAAIAEDLFNRLFLQEFRFHLMGQADKIGALFRHAPAQVDTLREMLSTPCHEVQRFLDLFMTILQAFNRDLGERYRNFVEASLLIRGTARARMVGSAG